MACLMDTENRCRKEEGVEPIIDSLKDAQVHSLTIYGHEDLLDVDRWQVAMFVLYSLIVTFDLMV